MLCAGLFAFSSGCIVVVEDLSNGQQRHLTGMAGLTWVPPLPIAQKGLKQLVLGGLPVFP